MKLRIHDSQWTDFAGSLRARQDVESAGLILAEPLPQTDDVLVARELVPIPDDGYAIREVDRLQIDPVALNRLVRPARVRGLSVFTVHTHPGADEPWFSYADDRGDARLMPSFFGQMDGPHGSLVIAGATGKLVGRAWQGPDASPTPLDVFLVGKQLGVHSAADARPAGGSQWFERQELALGERGQRLLRRLRVGVVGLGGTGSVSSAQLSHLGVGELLLVDGDLVEPSNVSRIIGATSADAGKTPKVEVARRYAAELGLGTKVNALEGHLGGSVPVEFLHGCDIIFSCVDRHTPRALLNRLAYSALVPVIDMGSGFRVDTRGRVTGSAGRVVLIGPDRPCLACWGHISPDRLRVEALTAEERADEAAVGYIDGADVPQPSVIAFNTAVSGAAVVEFLRLVTRFAGADDPPLRLAFAFESGLVRRNRPGGTRACKICSG